MVLDSASCFATTMSFAKFPAVSLFLQKLRHHVISRVISKGSVAMWWSTDQYLIAWRHMPKLQLLLDSQLMCKTNKQFRWSPDIYTVRNNDSNVNFRVILGPGRLHDNHLVADIIKGHSFSQKNLWCTCM